MIDGAGAAGWSATTLDVHRRLRELRNEGEPAALATVVDVEGSAYRRPGAKMALTPDGEQVGAITAGCLEGPVGDLAETVLAGGPPVLETFDLTEDDGWGLGMGCNGIVDVFVEPVDASLDGTLAALEGDVPGCVVTAIESTDPGIDPGARAVVGPAAGAETGTATDADGGARTGTSPRQRLPDPIREELREPAEECAATGGTATRRVETGRGSVRAFLEGIEPPPQLLVFGGQPDTAPVARLATDLGFRVTVATPRGGLAEPDRFPGAEEALAVRPADLDAHVDDRTNVVVMTHNLADDVLALEALAETDVPYVGLLGPSERFEEIRANLAAEGVELPEAFLERIATPVGLDLGGGTPVEIALSIVAELVAVENGRDGGRLRDREGPIHCERAELPE